MEHAQAGMKDSQAYRRHASPSGEARRRGGDDDAEGGGGGALTTPVFQENVVAGLNMLGGAPRRQRTNAELDAIVRQRREGRRAEGQVWSNAEMRRYLMTFTRAPQPNTGLLSRPLLSPPQIAALSDVVPEMDEDRRAAERMVFKNAVVLSNHAVSYDEDLFAFRWGGAGAADALTERRRRASEEHPREMQILARELAVMMDQVPSLRDLKRWTGLRESLLSHYFDEALVGILGRRYRDRPDIRWQWISAFPRLHLLATSASGSLLQRVASRVRNGGLSYTNWDPITHCRSGADRAFDADVDRMAELLADYCSQSRLEIRSRLDRWRQVLDADGFDRVSHMLQCAELFSRAFHLPADLDEIEAHSGLFDG